tara:strand:- start:120 stop:653 length:534 start_codon:yes stop_codon:yes gene_type:complete
MKKENLMVCVDGVDGTGKTLLTTFLEEKLSIRRYSPIFPVVGERAPQELKKWSDIAVCDMYAMYGFPIIMDRSFLSVCVYEVLEFEERLIEKWVENVSTYDSVIHIILYGEGDLLEFQKRKNDKFIPTDILKRQNILFLKYGKIFEEKGLRVFKFRSDIKSAEIIRGEVLNVIKANL